MFLGGKGVHIQLLRESNYCIADEWIENPKIIRDAWRFEEEIIENAKAFFNVMTVLVGQAVNDKLEEEIALHLRIN